MKTVLIAVALLSGTAALAQSDIYTPPADPVTPVDATMSDTTTPDPVTAETTAPTMTMVPTGQTALPSNAAPEHDARGIAVISDAAAVPAGYNGTPGTLVGTGGPLVDPADTAATGEPATTPDASYPACTRTVTDNCLQTYERGRQR